MAVAPKVSERQTEVPEPTPGSLHEARKLASGCRRCDLYRNATQTVFGEGAVPSALMLVGEQPGDQEDRQGRPFVGPAGRVLDRALADAGIPRDAAYVTNAVKHFKNVPRGKRRIHQKPNLAEMRVCKWWLDLELALVAPRVVVALGATAARALLGRAVTIGKERGQAVALRDGLTGFVTVHPSFILRQGSDAARDGAYRGLVADLALVAERLGRGAP